MREDGRVIVECYASGNVTAHVVDCGVWKEAGAWFSMCCLWKLRERYADPSEEAMMNSTRFMRGLYRYLEPKTIKRWRDAGQP